jgi:hypothetical protein
VQFSSHGKLAGESAVSAVRTYFETVSVVQVQAVFLHEMSEFLHIMQLESGLMVLMFVIF